MTMGKIRDVDRGRAWLIGFVSFFSQFLVGVLCYGAGVIHIALLQHFGEDVAFTAFIGSVFTSLLSLAGPIASILINVGSCRLTHIVGGSLCFAGFSLSFFVQRLDLLLLTYGILAGIGQSLIVTPAIVILGFYFDKYRGIVMGAAVSGAGFGMFASGPIVQYFIDQYGLHGSFLMLGGISAHFVLLGVLMKPSSVELLHHRKKKLYRNANTKNSCCNCGEIYDLSVFKNKTYIFILLGNFLWNIPYSSILLHLPNFAVIRGSSIEDAALLLTYIGLGSTINRVLTGLAIGLDPLLLFTGTLGITGLFTIFFPLYSHVYFGQCIFSFIFGMYSGGLMALLGPLALDLVGLSQLSSALGMMFLIGGIGYILGPPLSGAIVDASGTYEDTFYMSGGLFLLACVFCLVSSTWRKDIINEDDFKDKDITFSDFKNSTLFEGSRFLSGSGFLTGSMALTIHVTNIEDKKLNKNENTTSLLREDTNSSKEITEKTLHNGKLNPTETV